MFFATLSAVSIVFATTHVHAATQVPALVTSNVRGIQKGFNFGSSDDFATEFKTMKNLQTTSGNSTGWNSARLYTMIDPNPSKAYISAIDTAVADGTTLLLGIYCSKPQAQITAEINAMSNAFKAHGQALANLVVGISVGSEDLYRSSPICKSDCWGDTIGNIQKYIAQTRAALATLGFSKVIPVGHVDTWQMFPTGWIPPVNNHPAVSVWGANVTCGGNVLITGTPEYPAVDFIGVDSYPYWANDAAGDTFAFTQGVEAVKDSIRVAGKQIPVWITETGWPFSGPSNGPAVVNGAASAQQFWQSVGCKYLFGTTNVWWYSLFDGTASPNFGIVSSAASTKPLYSLAC